MGIAYLIAILVLLAGIFMIREMYVDMNNTRGWKKIIPFTASLLLAFLLMNYAKQLFEIITNGGF